MKILAFPSKPQPDLPPTTELHIQRAIVDLLTRAARPGIAWTHMPSGELRHPAIAGKLKGMGTKAGWPDLLLVRHGKMYGLELKTATGRISPAQASAHADLELAGATIAVTHGLDAAIFMLREWEMIR